MRGAMLTTPLTGSTQRAFVYDFSSPARHMAFTAIPMRTEAALRDGQLLVAVHAFALNPVDYKLPMMVPFASLFMSGLPVAQDFAGIVIASRDATFPPGARVFGTCEGSLGGAATEIIIVSSAAVANMPSNLSFSDAAALNTVAQTGLQAFRFGGLASGGRALIVGASGGCGSIGVQLAREIVGPTGSVVGVAGSSSAAAVLSLGADACVDYNSDIVTELLAGERFDLIYDTVSSAEKGDDLRGVRYIDALRPCLKPGGKYVSINGTASEWIRALLCSCCLPRGVVLFFQSSSAEDLRYISSLVADQKLHATVDTVHSSFTEENCESAYARLKSRRAKGKLVIQVVATEGQ